MDTDFITDLFPHFHADAHGNIVAYSNGQTVTIVHANRRRDAYTDPTTTTTHGGERTGHRGYDQDPRDHDHHHAVANNNATSTATNGDT